MDLNPEDILVTQDDHQTVQIPFSFSPLKLRDSICTETDILLIGPNSFKFNCV